MQSPKGTIGLLGPNGAGKSTLLKLILGIVHPSAGSMNVLGLDVKANATTLRAQIGYMPEGDTVIPDLSAHQYTTLAAELCGLPHSEAVARAHQVLHYVGLGEARYRKLGGFSTGMRQRARLAQALVGNPKLLLLDEPTSGLDPRGREEMLNLIADIPARSGASVILSTHILPDVERTCEQIIVLSSGTVLYNGELAPLLSQKQRCFELRGKGDLKKLETTMEQASYTATIKGDTLQITVPQNISATELIRVATEQDFQVRHLAPLKHTLEQAFMNTLKEAGHLS
ncbi:MAG: ABC transporter ATP-binding protein [Myxococcales bacterium]|nr:MAG: ABC transporter ATP-binding protein [Myxococcales bacterium]